LIVAERGYEALWVAIATEATSEFLRLRDLRRGDPRRGASRKHSPAPLCPKRHDHDAAFRWRMG
jgi:hypothetical protein